MPMSTTRSSSSTVASIPRRYASFRSESCSRSQHPSPTPRRRHTRPAAARRAQHGARRLGGAAGGRGLQHVKVVGGRGPVARLPALHAQPLQAVLVAADEHHAVLSHSFEIAVLYSRALPRFVDPPPPSLLP